MSPIAYGQPSTRTASLTVPVNFHGEATSEPSDREKAEKSHMDAFEALADVHDRLKAVRTLFGPALADALRGPIDTAQDHSYDSSAHFRRALDREADVARWTQDENRRLRERLADAVADVDRLSAELVARHKKARKPIPEWIAEIRSDVEVPF